MSVEEEVCKLLSETGPLTYLEMAELLGIKKTSANERFQRMHRTGIVHIAGWKKGSWRHMAVFDLGQTNDVPKPAPKSPKVSRKEWEAKMKKKGMWPKLLKKWQDQRCKKRVKTVKKINIPIHRDPILAALMGV